MPALAESLAHGSTEAIVVSLPRITLQSAKSHVLDEPVPRDSSMSTLPWDCTLHHGSVMVLHGGSVRYLLEPFTVQTTLAMQQEGTGITIHTETLALSLSQQLVCTGYAAAACTVHVHTQCMSVCDVHF